MSSTGKKWSELDAKANPVAGDSVGILDSEVSAANQKNKTTLISSLAARISSILGLGSAATRPSTDFDTAGAAAAAQAASQPLNSNLTYVGANISTLGKDVIAADDPATLQSLIGLGTLATQDTVPTASNTQFVLDHLSRVANGLSAVATPTLIGTVGGVASVYNTNVSTFSGWDTPIGPKQGFNQVVFDLYPFDSASIPTLMRVQIIQGTDPTGTVLADVDVVLPTMTAATYQTVTVNLGATIANAGAANLRLNFRTNGHCSFRTGNVTTYNSSYGQLQYSTTSNLTGTLWNTGTHDNVYANYYLSNVQTVEETGVPVSFTDNNSTFSAWGAPVGVRQNFNRIEFAIQCWDRTIPFATQVRCRVLTTNKNGTVLADKTVTLTTVPTFNKPYPVTIDFDSTITNSGGASLWVEFYTDTHTGHLQLATIPYAPPTYPLRAYATDRSLTTSVGALNDVSSGSNAGMWCRFSLVDHSQDVLSSPQDYQTKFTTLADTPFTSIYHTMPATMYALEGRECNIYFQNFLRSNFDLSLFRINVTCTKGEQDNDRWYYTPVAADAGSLAWTASIYWNNTLVLTVSTTIVIKALTAGNGITRKLVSIGDSTTASGEWLSEVMNLFGSNRHSPGRISSLTSSSTTATVTTPYPHGLTTGNSVTISGANETNYNVTAPITVTSVTTFTYTITATTSPATGTPVFSGIADVMSITEVGSRSVACNDAGGTTRTTHTDAVSGKTINYFYTDPASPFVFSSAFNFTQYLSTNSITLASGDWVMIHLGINDVFNYVDDASLLTGMATMDYQLDAMITNIKAAVSGIRIGLLMTIPGNSTQDSYGWAYGSAQTRWRYERNRALWLEQLLVRWTGVSNVYLFPLHLSLDTVNNTLQQATIFNARNLNTYQKQVNSVHPNIYGYWQMADSIKCFLKGLET